MSAPTRARMTTDSATLVKRLLGCLAGSVVLAVMVGSQEGTQDDYYKELSDSIISSRIFLFLALGVLAFLAITFWPTVIPYLTRPGVIALASGVVAVVAGQTLMRWYDPVGKFGQLATQVDKTPSGRLSAVTTAFFDWLAWTQLVAVIVLCGVAIIARLAVVAWVAAVIAAAAAVIAWYSHDDVVSLAGGVDHSLGYATVAIGYLVVVGAAVIIAMSSAEDAAPQQFINRLLGWRPGLPIVVLGFVLGLLAFMVGRWYAPVNPKYNTEFGDMSDLFKGTGLKTFAGTYLSWLGWALLLVSAAVAGAATYLRSRPLAWAGAVLGIGASAYSLATLYQVSKTAARVDAADGGTWQNLGAGGWMACAAFLLIGGGGFVAATAYRRGPGETKAKAARTPHASNEGGFLTAPGAVRTAVMVAIAFALFYPPTATQFWQKVLVSEIGIYVLLAVGLNVVVGWAGLLDLGFIAFYAIGSYTTAYFTGVLPVKPPSWLTMTPLLAIPFAIAVCLIAGLLLGAPTLRLRGDYLAIVTLGFGEIIRIIANNADSVTNGSRGTAVDPSRGVNNVPNPAIHVGPVNIQWGLNQLQYWYLLLVFLVIVVLLFRRLENSRIGRAWAAIREDEVAAQASGVNTFRIKLLAFAIGASTSGLAGVFFASQIGFFNPDNFVLNNSILVVAYVVFGGMGSLTGAMAGAALLTWLPEFLKDQVPSEDRQMWIGALLLLMMIFRPGGLIQAKRRRIELHGDDVSAETFAVPAGGGL